MGVSKRVVRQRHAAWASRSLQTKRAPFLLRPNPRVRLVGMRVIHRNNKTLAVLGSSSAARVLDSNAPDPWDKSFDAEVCQLPNARIGPQHVFFLFESF